MTERAGPQEKQGPLADRLSKLLPCHADKVLRNEAECAYGTKDSRGYYAACSRCAAASSMPAILALVRRWAEGGDVSTATSRQAMTTTTKPSKKSRSRKGKVTTGWGLFVNARCIDVVIQRNKPGFRFTDADGAIYRRCGAVHRVEIRKAMKA